MRYFGSKASTVSPVVDLALKNFSAKTAADAFGGLGTIGAELRRRQLVVTTCDLLNMPHSFQFSKIACGMPPRYLNVRRKLGLPSREALAYHLNNVRDGRSWLVKEFCSQRKFFHPKNASRIAGAWNSIRNWHKEGLLSEAEKNHIVASFINSADACANTAGTYYAYLKDWDRKAERDFQFSFLDIPEGLPKGQALLGDALECLRGKSFDLLYLDPPYNDRDYSRYYHLPESLSKLTRPSTNTSSLSGQPLNASSTSPKFRAALHLDYMARLVEDVKWRRLVVQYCDGAFIPLMQLREFLGSQGNMQEFTLDALGYTSKSQDRWLKHHVFIVDQPAKGTTRSTLHPNRVAALRQR